MPKHGIAGEERCNGEKEMPSYFLVIFASNMSLIEIILFIYLFLFYDFIKSIIVILKIMLLKYTF